MLDTNAHAEHCHAEQKSMSAEQRRAAIYGKTLKHFFAPVAHELYEDDSVSEVLINGPYEIFVERRGRLEKIAATFASEFALRAAVTNLAEYVDRRIDVSQPSLDARLPAPEKFRVNVIGPPCARAGLTVSIRKFQKAMQSVDSLVAGKSLSEQARQFLEVAVRAKRNILVSGATSTGKTTFLNAVSSVIAPEERVVVIEDSSELQLPDDAHTVYLEARPQSADRRLEPVTIRDLFVNSLRMRPDRIIVGEVRRGEALDMVQSMLSGHDGAMGTIHASSPALALVRLETLCLMSDVNMPVHVARTQVASAIHLVVQLAKIKGRRVVSSIARVIGIDPKTQTYAIELLFRRSQSSTDADALVSVPDSRLTIPLESGLSAADLKTAAPLCAEMFSFDS